MIAKKAPSRSEAAQTLRTEYTWVATAALIVALIVGGSVAVPQAAAQGSTGAGESEPSRFSSQAEAIDYYVAMVQRDREDVAAVSFSSQAEAIDYYLAMVQRDREEEASVSFSSQAEAIDHYLAMAQCDAEDVAGASFSSQAEAIDYYLAMAQREQAGGQAALCG